MQFFMEYLYEIETLNLWLIATNWPKSKHKEALVNLQNAAVE